MAHREPGSGEATLGTNRARDTRLDRLVALKVLPRDVQDDPERRERFEREARAIAGAVSPRSAVAKRAPARTIKGAATAKGSLH